MVNKILSIFKDTDHSFEGQETDENVIHILRRHPFYIILKLIFLTLIGLVPIIVGVHFRHIMEAKGLMSLYLFLTALWYMLMWILIFYALTIYTLSTVIITNKRVIENEQHGVFDRKVSELHVSRIQDVSVHTNGFIETLFKFGDITVQTAGVEKQFVFHQLPRAERVKDEIMQVTSTVHNGLRPF